MFKSKKSKTQSLDTVDKLLSTYLQTSDKKILKSKNKINKKHQASTILEMNSKLGNFKKNKIDLKKSKQKERKIRNKEMKKHELINEKIIRQSKLNNKDEEIINEIINKKLKDLKRIDFVSKNEDLIDLQNDILNLTKIESTKKKLNDLKDKRLLAAKRKNAKLDAFNEKIEKGYISITGLTPGLAQPGDDDSDESEDEEIDNGLHGFKDDFDNYH
jgi:hypothetical protein